MKKYYHSLVIKLFMIDSETICRASLEELDDKHLIDDWFEEIWS